MVHKVLKETKVHKVLKVHKELKETKEVMVLQVRVEQAV